MLNQNQYYTLNLGTIQVKHSRQSLHRYWNRLQRLQKTIIIVILFLFIVYISTHFHFHGRSIKKISEEHKHEEPINKARLQIEEPPTNSLIKKKSKIVFKGPSNEMQEKIVNAFKHAWQGYKKYAWGEDELKPISKTKSSWFNLGLTIIDSLDTMYIMNLNDSFKESREWVQKNLNVDVDRYNNLFEITIRIIGGLLSVYHLSGDELFLQKAYDIANRTMSAFDSPSQIPLSDVNLARRSAKSPYWTSDSSISEVATLQIEFKDLARETNDKRFAIVVKRISKKIHDLNKYDGLVPIFISTNYGRFVGNTITLGARGDSYYEYLLKQWIQNGAKYDENTENKIDNEIYLLDDWIESINGIKKRLLGYSKPNNLTFIGESISDTFSPKMDHLVCFLPGNLALGSSYLRYIDKFNKDAEATLKLAEELMETCYKMYSSTATGLSPEIVHFNMNDNLYTDIYIKDADKHNLLRPETIESLYYLYKLTKNKKYQEYGKKIFDAFEKYTKVESGGYTSINDVTNIDNVGPKDKMESFFLAETLKYFYLLFENDFEPNIDLNKWIFNSEGHLFPIFN